MSRRGDFPPIRRYRSRNSLTRSSLVGRPPRTSRRNGPTSSSELGPPTAVNRTAVRSSSEILDTTASSSPPGRFVDEPHERSQLVLRRLRQDSVAWGEHVAVMVPDAVQHVLSRRPPNVRRAEARRRVQIALDAPVLANPPPSGVDRNPPVDAND